MYLSTIFNPIYSTRPELDTILKGLLVPTSQHKKNLKPRIDIGKNEKQYDVSVMLPGLSKEDVFVEVEGNKFVIRCTIKESNNLHNKYYFSMGSFEERFKIPKDVNIKNISATMKDGVLVVTLKRAKPDITHNKNITIK